MKRRFLLVEVLIALAIVAAVLIPFSSITLNTSKYLIDKTAMLRDEMGKETLLYEGLKRLIQKNSLLPYSTNAGSVRYEQKNTLLTIYATVKDQKAVKRQFAIEIDN